MKVFISDMEEQDLQQVCEIENACFSTPWSRQAFWDSIKSNDYEYIVAKDENENVMGYAGMQVVLDEAEITNIAVAYSFRRLGISQKLLETLFLLCKKRGVALLHLEVRESNEPARCLYEKNHFHIDGIRKNFYDRPKENAVLMTKNMEEN